MMIEKCRNCGCTNLNSCFENCHWVEKNKCSACYNSEGYLKGKKLKKGQKRLL